ncbi:MAG: phosphotransferase [Alphaproteobacteria bacterium]|nr:phosphotransferase [Alphaproteobacteria bacterium]
MDAGLINQTHGVAVRGRLVGVLQRLNTHIFRAEVHHDIDAVTRHLAAKGLPTTRLVPTQAGGLWHTDADGGVWRVLLPIGDRTVHKIADVSDAREAGALVARFHAATADLDHAFRFTRPGAHDTDKHMADLRMALMMHRGHRLYDAVARLSDGILDGWDAWEGPSDLPERIIHGDLKISNVRFTGGEATALIDLDTLARGTIDVELGDAMRSWCNPASENVTNAVFDAGIFRAAMEGYRRDGSLTADEWDAIVPGIERICLELSARFARDALEESYFGFDPSYGGRGEHNLLRARGQASLARSVREQRGALQASLARS